MCDGKAGEAKSAGDSAKTMWYACGEDARAATGAPSRVQPDHAIALASLKVLGHAGGVDGTRSQDGINDGLAVCPGASASLSVQGLPWGVMDDAPSALGGSPELRNIWPRAQSPGPAIAHRAAWGCSQKLAIARSLLQQHAAKEWSTTEAPGAPGEKKRRLAGSRACISCRRAKVCVCLHVCVCVLLFLFVFS